MEVARPPNEFLTYFCRQANVQLPRFQETKVIVEEVTPTMWVFCGMHWLGILIS